jgi:hypothetical protein
LRFHDVFYGVFILNEGDDPHLSFALGALERIDFVYAFYARGPSAPSKLLPIVILLFLRWRRGELSPLAATPT